MSKAVQPIRAIVGLGNPGTKYADTRHNAGFWFVDRLARRFCGQFRAEAKFFGEICRIQVDGRDCWLLKPTTFMNRSGQAVAALARFYKFKPEEILVAHDEIDLPAGEVKLKSGGGHGGHNGLRDIIPALGSKDFLRLRIGVGHPGHRDAVVDYVLDRPSRSEQEAIEAALDRAEAQVEALLMGNIAAAMNVLHSSA